MHKLPTAAPEVVAAEVEATPTSPTWPTWPHYRAQVAALSRDRRTDDPELIEARRNLRATRLADHVAKALAAAPPLTAEQRRSVARLLTASPGSPPTPTRPGEAATHNVVRAGGSPDAAA